MKKSCTQAPVVLVTGSARRIGATIAQLLHEMGYQVIIHYNTSENEANHLVQELNQHRPDSAISIQANLSEQSAAISLIDQAIKWAGKLDVLINNASIFLPTDISGFCESTWEALFSVNVKAPFWLSQHACAHLKHQKGSIINITDIHASKPLKNYSLYCQSKAALNMQTLSLAKEFSPDIRVNAVAPGAIEWPEHHNNLSEKQKNHIIESTLLKKHGNPIHIAQAVCTLIENDFMTGVIIPVDGGRRIK